MGSNCKCARKIEAENDTEEDFENNCRMIEEIMAKLNYEGMSQTAIWPDSNFNSVVLTNSNIKFKNNENIQNNSALNYDLNIPLIRKQNYIFTLKEYFAAKKIMNFLRKIKSYHIYTLKL